MNINTGQKIRQLRKERRLTLLEFSKLSGVAVATLSRMESNKMAGTVATYVSICKALGITVSEFFAGLDTNSSDIQIKTYGDVIVNKSQYSILILATQSQGKMKSTLISINPNSSIPDEKSKAGSEKFIYVMEGNIIAKVGNRDHSLKKGNSLYFKSSLPHAIKNTSKREAKILCVESQANL